jgi:hypothetical protein
MNLSNLIASLMLALGFVVGSMCAALAESALEGELAQCAVAHAGDEYAIDDCELRVLEERVQQLDDAVEFLNESLRGLLNATEELNKELNGTRL